MEKERDFEKNKEITSEVKKDWDIGGVKPKNEEKWDIRIEKDKSAIKEEWKLWGDNKEEKSLDNALKEKWDIGGAKEEKKEDEKQEKERKELEEIKKQSKERWEKDKDIKKRVEIFINAVKPAINGDLALKKEEKNEKNSIDKQIAEMEVKLKNTKNQLAIFNKKATSEQKEMRQKEIAVLEQGIKEARVRKKELETERVEEKKKNKIDEKSLPEVEEIKEIKEKIEKMPENEREKIGIGLRNVGFFAQEMKSRAMAWICETSVAGEKIKGDTLKNRFFLAMAKSYKKDEVKARKDIEKREESKTSIKQLKNAGFLAGNVMKIGRTAADVIGWTAGSPLRYVMLGAQFFSRGAEAAKEARLMNEKSLIKANKDSDEASEEAWKIYEMAKLKSGNDKISKEILEKAYVENLPQNLLDRLKKSEPGTATGILQKILKKDLELAIKYGKANENKLKEYDRLIGQYGVVDALAMGAKYAETAGKAVIAGVQIETAALLMQKLPEIMSKLSSMSFFDADIKPSSASSIVEQVKPLIHADENINADDDLEHSSENFKFGAETDRAEKYSFENDKINVKTSSVSSINDNEIASEEHIEKLTAIQKGEGIEHALIRQLIDDPKKFGFQGDINNKAEIKMWANGESHRIAIDNGYVDPESGQETRILENKEKPTFVILQDDKTIKFENADLYKTSSSELKRTLEYEKHFENKNDIIDKKIEEIKENILQEKIAGDQEMIEERTREMIKQENLKRGIEKSIEDETAKNEAILEKEYKKITDKQIEEIIEKNKITPEENESVEKFDNQEIISDAKPDKIYNYEEELKILQKNKISGIFSSSEKQEIFDRLIDKNNIITISDVENMAEKIKKGNITVEDFGRYYAAINADAEKLSPKLLSDLKKNFEIINKGEKESVLAKKTIQIMLQKIRK